MLTSLVDWPPLLEVVLEGVASSLSSSGWSSGSWLACPMLPSNVFPVHWSIAKSHLLVQFMNTCGSIFYLWFDREQFWQIHFNNTASTQHCLQVSNAAKNELKRSIPLTFNGKGRCGVGFGTPTNSLFWSYGTCYYKEQKLCKSWAQFIGRSCIVWLQSISTYIKEYQITVQ